MKERELFAALAMQELLRWELADNKENKINIVALSKNAYLMADERIKVGDRINSLPEDIENIA